MAALIVLVIVNVIRFYVFLLITTITPRIITHHRSYGISILQVVTCA